MPTGNDEDDKPYLVTETDALKAVADYAHMSFSDCLLLDCVTYKKLVRDSLIFKMRQTKEGQDYLEDCWLLKQTQPDRKKLRKKFKGGENING